MMPSLSYRNDLGPLSRSFLFPMRILIQNRQRKFKVDRHRVLRWARKVLVFQKCAGAELGIVFVNDRRIRIYNRDYRGKDKPTDVLAFSMREGVGGDFHPRLIGDVMISLERSAEEAALYGRLKNEQLLILLIHGILHLLGYDHERSPEEARRMERRERFLMKKLWKG